MNRRKTCRLSRYFCVLLLVALWIPVVSGCKTSEYTGRRQLLLTSESQETRLGLQAYQEILSQSKISHDSAMTAVLRRVGSRIAAAAHRPDYEWEFTLIESDQINAFCLPGGKIAFYTGIIPILQNEAGMAAVMGHEVAHALLRHGGERMSQNMTTAVIEQAVKIGVSGSEPATQKAVLGVFGAGSQVGVLLPYSRTHELEADKLGLDLAAKAGYDPREAVALWERMKAAGGSKPPEILSTHPSEEHRIERLQEFMPEAMKIYESNPNQYGLGQRW